MEQLTEEQKLKDALRDVLADLLAYEPGNPWRLDSVKAASEILTGDRYGFDSAAALEHRRLTGRGLGGRFKWQ